MGGDEQGRRTVDRPAAPLLLWGDYRTVAAPDGGEAWLAPGAPPYVRGILNLRGQIVTIIDLGLKLGLSDPIHLNMQTRNIIVRSGGESIGLLVERIGDVVRVASDEVDAPPANMNGLHGKFFDGVVKTVDELIGILNVEKILE